MKSLLCPLLAFPVAALAVSPEQEIGEKVPKALRILDAWQADGPVNADKKLHIVYWTPSDREPVPGYRNRLSTIMEDIRRFYGKEMIRLGFGPKSIRLDNAKDGKIVVHLVKGTKPYSSYGDDSGHEIRDECLPVLQQAGIEPGNETFLIFCNMANWNPAEKTISQNSPYYASGTNAKGTGWQVDSPILNLDYLDKKEPAVKDGQYGDISVGKYNSYFIGGIAHELGHALGLPHNCPRPDEKEAFGTPLMGEGNRTYGDERRGEGRGSFLTLADGLKLASHPMFSGSAKGLDQPASAIPADISITGNGPAFTYSAKVTADPPVYAVVGYMDPEGSDDYNASTCTAVPDADGSFTLEANALVPGKSGVFRVVLIQSNGAASSFSSATSPFVYPYRVAADGKIDLSVTEASLTLSPLLKLAKDNSILGIREEVRRLEKAGIAPPLAEVAKVLAESINFRPDPSPAEQKKDICHLSEATMISSSAGYGKATPNRLPGNPVLWSCGSRLFPRGIYAHAPALHQWDLGAKWKKLEGTAGLQDGNGGSCIFIIKADGKELWRSEKTIDGTARDFSLSVEGVKELEFIVGDAGDGNHSDWGCWFSPTLTR